MIAPGPWVGRTFAFDLPVTSFPMVLERLRGTPARAAALVSGVPEAALAVRPNGAWSAKDHIGHLTDLGELDDRRVAEFLARTPVLSAADMGNRRTWEAGHAERPIGALLDDLRVHREALVRRLDALTAEQVALTAEHPRLKRPLRLVDWAFFVAEHDDHHLAHARRALRGG